MFRDHLPGQAPSPRIDSTGSRNASPAPSRGSSSRNSSEDPATQPEQGMSWEAYAEVHKPNNGPTHFKCLWETTNNGKTSVCGYYAKKQLVKRHIETTHMKLKPYLCEYCGKAFPQKTSLDIHRSTHNGSRPHACHFDCGQTFRDPARRHKHHVDAHNYIPKQPKRNRRLDDSNMDQL
ncbi:hypothetical protein DL96DRAFT_1594691 [Flagelloscypha sp. PMI_526]|nr:hypothetical protein DL96DRAFT_1594691 [Flagelloscypha sp. PMI_526]